MSKELTILVYLIGFCIIMVIQSLFINGLYHAFSGKELNDLYKGKTWDGNILYPVKRFLRKYINNFWQRPLFDCIRCMSSIYGTITFVPFVIYLFGFRLVEIPILIVDIFCLSYLNYYFFKKI